MPQRNIQRQTTNDMPTTYNEQRSAWAQAQYKKLVKSRLKELRILFKGTIGEEEFNRAKYYEKMKPHSVILDKLVADNQLSERLGRAKPDMTEEQKSSFQTVVALNRSIKDSMMCEKFHRYAYNIDIIKMKKYHDKISEKDATLMDDMSECHQDGGSLSFNMIDLNGDGSNNTESTASAAHLDFAKMIKKDHDHRVNIIGVIEKCASLGLK